MDSEVSHIDHRSTMGYSSRSPHSGTDRHSGGSRLKLPRFAWVIDCRRLASGRLFEKHRTGSLHLIITSGRTSSDVRFLLDPSKPAPRTTAALVEEAFDPRVLSGALVTGPVMTGMMGTPLQSFFRLVWFRPHC